MRAFLFLMIFSLSGVANIYDIPDKKSIAVKGKFARNKKCVRCHLDIYKEFKHSAHHHANILNNKAHKAMWQSNPLSKEQKYLCAKCHAPAAEKIDAMMEGREEISPFDKSVDDGIGCAFCHRIATIEPTPKGDHYHLSLKKQKYFGGRVSRQKSDFHQIDSNNTVFKKGDICFSCHAHHKKQKLLVSNKKEEHFENFCVFSFVDTNVTEIAKNSATDNCISCHMPKVEGSFTDRYTTTSHRSHRFLGLRNKFLHIERYLDLNITQIKNRLKVQLINRMPHDLILHPTRLFKLQLFVDGVLKSEHVFEKESQTRDLKPFVWLKKKVRYFHNLLAKSRFEEEFTLPLDAKEVDVVLGYYLIKPTIAQKIGLTNKEDTKFHVLLKKSLRIKKEG